MADGLQVALKLAATIGVFTVPVKQMIATKHLVSYENGNTMPSWVTRCGEFN